jgi:hypothetical protein
VRRLYRARPEIVIHVRARVCGDLDVHLARRMRRHHILFVRLEDSVIINLLTQNTIILLESGEYLALGTTSLEVNPRLIAAKLVWRVPL